MNVGVGAKRGWGEGGWEGRGKRGVERARGTTPD